MGCFFRSSLCERAVGSWEQVREMDFSRSLNFHGFFSGLGSFQESKQLGRGHTPAMDA